MRKLTNDLLDRVCNADVGRIYGVGSCVCVNVRAGLTSAGFTVTPTSLTGSSCPFLQVGGGRGAAGSGGEENQRSLAGQTRHTDYMNMYTLHYTQRFPFSAGTRTVHTHLEETDKQIQK